MIESIPPMYRRHAAKNESVEEMACLVSMGQWVHRCLPYDGENFDEAEVKFIFSIPNVGKTTCVFYICSAQI